MPLFVKNKFLLFHLPLLVVACFILGSCLVLYGAQQSDKWLTSIYGSAFVIRGFTADCSLLGKLFIL